MFSKAHVKQKKCERFYKEKTDTELFVILKMITEAVLKDALGENHLYFFCAGFIRRGLIRKIVNEISSHFH